MNRTDRIDRWVVGCLALLAIFILLMAGMGALRAALVLGISLVLLTALVMLCIGCYLLVDALRRRLRARRQPRYVGTVTMAVDVDSAEFKDQLRRAAERAAADGGVL